ncbi:MAG: glycosyltransferase 87 family protein [Parvularculaceae bacterium]
MLGVGGIRRSFMAFGDTAFAGLDLSAPRTERLLAAAVLLFFLIALLPLVLFDHPRPGPVDFHHLWTAGKMWASGQSPYAAERAALFAQYGLPHVYAAPAPFFYPPHAVLALAPLGALSPGAASLLFSIINVCALIASSVLAADLVRSAGAPGSRLSWASLHAILLVAGWNATSIIFFHNILTLIVYLGLLAMLRGAQTGRAAYVVAGGFLALLSPQMSAAAALALLMRPRTRAPMLASFGLITVISVIGLQPGGILPSLKAMLSNLAAYSDFPANTHAAQSGVGFFLFGAFGLSPGTGALIAACTLALALFAALSDRAGETEAGRSVEFAILAIVTGLFFLPSLSQYYIAATPALFLLIRNKSGWRLVGFIGALMLMRSLDLLNGPAGIAWISGRETAAATDSIGVALLFAACVGSWASGRAGRGIGGRAARPASRRSGGR